MRRMAHLAGLLIPFLYTSVLFVSSIHGRVFLSCFYVAAKAKCLTDIMGKRGVTVSSYTRH